MRHRAREAALEVERAIERANAAAIAAARDEAEAQSGGGRPRRRQYQQQYQQQRAFSIFDKPSPRYVQIYTAAGSERLLQIQYILLNALCSSCGASFWYRWLSLLFIRFSLQIQAPL